MTISVIGVGAVLMQAMGFNSAKARDALEDANCDVDAAIEWLLVSCV